MKESGILKKIDFVLILAVFLLVGIGVLGVSVAMSSPNSLDEESAGVLQSIANLNLRYVVLTLIWFGTGLVLGVTVCCINYHRLQKFTPLIYLGVLGLLVLVFLIGTIAGGAKSWFSIGPYKLQPSEFAKISLILSLSAFLTSERFDAGINTWKDMILIGGIVGLPFVMILMQPDLGTAMVFMVITMFILFSAKLNWKKILVCVVAAAAMAVLAWFFVLDNYQKNRLLLFVNPDLDPSGLGYQLKQSLTAIGSGRLFGKGLFGENMLSQLDFLPAKSTDFIFAVIIESMGFVMGFGVLLLYFIMLMRILKNARKSDDRFGMLICTGVAGMFFAHIFENIGMTMGIMPITGIPLPFLSYGGSSMWTNLISIGLVLSVGIHRSERITVKTKDVSELKAMRLNAKGKRKVRS